MWSYKLYFDVIKQLTVVMCNKLLNGVIIINDCKVIFQLKENKLIFLMLCFNERLAN